MTYESELEEIEHKNQMVDLICDHIINWNGVGVCAQPLQGIKEVYRDATRNKVGRTSAEIFWQTLELARELYSVRGYTVPVGHRFDLATHGHETQAWDGACVAQLMLTNTDLGDVMSDMEESDFILPVTTPADTNA